MNEPSVNVISTPKSSTFQMKLNPETKRRAEEIYARHGLTLTDAVNIFIQTSLNEGGAPFLLSPENQAFRKWMAGKRLEEESQKGIESAEREGWISEEEAYRMLGIEE